MSDHEVLLVIRWGMAEKGGVRWLGADVAHSEIGNLLEERIGDQVSGGTIDDLSDALMEMLFAKGKPQEGDIP